MYIPINKIYNKITKEWNTNKTTIGRERYYYDNIKSFQIIKRGGTPYLILYKDTNEDYVIIILPNTNIPGDIEEVETISVNISDESLVLIERNKDYNYKKDSISYNRIKEKIRKDYLNFFIDNNLYI